MSITIKEFDGYDFNEGVGAMNKKATSKKKDVSDPKKKSTKEACKPKKK